MWLVTFNDNGKIAHVRVNVQDLAKAIEVARKQTGLRIWTRVCRIK